MTDVIEVSITVDATNAQLKASELLAQHTDLSQTKIKDAMQKGAVWLHRNKGKQRLRRSRKPLKEGDMLELNYDANILRQRVSEPELIHDEGNYSIWFKPFGLNCQGSRWGDFATINRWVETHPKAFSDRKERSVFLVHRLDRATTGLILLCHSKSAAQSFSEMFKLGKVDKRYQAIVAGDFSELPENYTVDSPVDGKEARTEFTHVEYKEGYSLVNVKLYTGRKHQIRQHLSSVSYPIIGDRLYGNGENEDADLQLQSVSLEFECPIKLKNVKVVIPNQYRLTLSA